MTTSFIVPPCREALTELYRDEHIVVVTKPSGLLSVPGMAELGHPIIGCEFYAHTKARAASDRLHLHASYLCFSHPDSGKTMHFDSPAPF